MLCSLPHNATEGFLKKSEALKARGREARERARERAGTTRIPDDAWWPEVELLMNLGHPTKEIAIALGFSDRRVRAIKSWGKTSGQTSIYLVDEKPRYGEALDKEFQPMMEFTVEAFELFFNRFSGRALAPHCREWVKEFCENTNLILNVPPRHAKTTIFGVWIPIWLLAMDRNHEIILVSKTAMFARRQAAEIAYHLKHNRDLVTAFGRFAPEEERGDTTWRPSQGDLMVVGRTREAQSGQLSIRAVGITGQVLGMQATCVVVDDATDSNIARSEVQREENIRWLQEEVLTRLMPGGHAVVVGQRVHFLDIYGELAAMVFKRDSKRNKRGDQLWTVISHPAVIDWETGQTLWPDLWDFDALMETYERIGSNSFECMFQQNPIPAGSTLVQPEWWERCHDTERNGFKGAKIEDSEGGYLPIARVISLDPSPTQFNGLVVADVPYTKDSFQCAIMETKHWQGGMRSIIGELERCIDQYNPDFLIIEHSTYTNWLHEDPLFQSLSRRTTVLGHNTGKNKGDPNLGVESLGGDIEFGRLSLPCGDEAGRQMSRLLEEEANVWPHGRHDDVLMALWFIKWNYKRLIPRGVLPTSFNTTGAPGTWRAITDRPAFDPVKWYRRQRVG